MKEKVSLIHYVQEKKCIMYERCYRNNRNSLFYARARTNTIKLEEHKGRGIAGYDKTCKLCKDGIEDIVHFIIDCKMLEHCRDYQLIDMNISNSEERMRKLLFRNRNYQEVGKMIKELWTVRRELLENIKAKQKVNYRTFVNRSNRTLQRMTCNSEPVLKKGGCDYPSWKHNYRSVGRG